MPAVLIDRRLGVVVAGGRAITVRARAWAVLLYLSSRPRALIAADELRREVWGDVVVSDKTVHNVVADLRQALRGSAAADAIETRRGRGYRWVAGAADAIAAPPPAGPTTLTGGTPLVPRSRSLAWLGRAWHDALGRAPRPALLVGEPGIGKSTILREFETLVRQDAAPPGRGVPATRPLVAVGCCFDTIGRREPYGPLLMALAPRLTADPRAQALLRRLAPTWLLQFPGLIDGAEIEQWQRLGSGSSAARRTREGVALLEELAAQQPLVLAIEDLHWADADSIDVLIALARRARAVPLLVVATLRAGRASAERSIATRLAALRRLAAEHEVARFTLEEVRAYLHLRLATASLPAGAAELLRERSGGNPLVLHSLTRQWMEGGMLRHGADGWRLAPGAALAAPQMPADVVSVIARELDGLAPALRRVLEAACVVGEVFTPAALADALAAPRERIELGLAALAQHQLVRLRADGRYECTHAVHRQVVRSSIPAARHRRLHRNVAAHLLAAPPRRDGSDDPGRIATHLAAAGDWRRAEAYFEQSAHMAMNRLDYGGAVVELEAAVQCIARNRPSPAAELRESQLQLLLANLTASQLGSGAPAAVRAFARAAALCDRHGERFGAFRAHVGLAYCHVVRGEGDAAAQVAAQLIEAARHGAPGMAAAAHSSAGLVHAWRGELRQARALLEQSLDESVRPDLPRVFDLRTMTRLHLTTVLAISGRHQAAERMHRAALRDNDANPLQSVRGLMLVYAGLSASLLRDRTAVAQLADAAIALNERYEMFGAQPAAEFLRVWSAAAPLADDALASMEAAIEALHAAGSVWLQPQLFALLAEAYLQRGRTADAERCVSAGLAHSEASGQRYHQAELHRLHASCILAESSERRGRRRMTSGRRAATGELERAVQLARAQGAGLFEARARADLAALQSRRSRA